MFEDLGYFREYWVNNKSLGMVTCDKDREVIGYTGKRKEVLTSELTLTNGKKIKAGTEVVTMLYPRCGKMIKNNTP